MIEAFLDAAKVFGDLVVEKTEFLGLESTMWFWVLFAVGMWAHNFRAWLRQLRLARVQKRMQQQVASERERDEKEA